MGDMADYLIESDPFDEDGDDYFSGYTYCRYCGGGPFYWMEEEAGWRLYTESRGIRHSCKAYQGRKV